MRTPALQARRIACSTQSLYGEVRPPFLRELWILMRLWGLLVGLRLAGWLSNSGSIEARAAAGRSPTCCWPCGARQAVGSFADAFGFEVVAGKEGLRVLWGGCCSATCGRKQQAEVTAVHFEDLQHSCVHPFKIQDSSPRQPLLSRLCESEEVVRIANSLYIVLATRFDRVSQSCLFSLKRCLFGFPSVEVWADV